MVICLKQMSIKTLTAMRIDRFLSLNGFGSRKSVKKYFHKGEVKINGEIITDYSTDITGCDVIEVNGIKVSNQPYITIMLNKPEGYLSSMIDERYPSVMNLIPEQYRKRVRIVGRLDYDTTGLLLLTDNGVLNSRLASPKYHIPKTYEVTVNHILKPGLVDIFKAGDIDIGRGEKAASSELVIKDEYHADITIHEGKYHEIKRLFGKYSYDVIKLHRQSLGPINLDVEVGKTRLLSRDEYLQLLKITHIKLEDSL